MRGQGTLLGALAIFVVACGGGSGGETSGTGGTGSSSTASGTGGAGTSTTASGTGGGVGGTGGAPGEPRFVAVGYGGRRLSSTDGIAWTHDIVVDPNGGDDDNLFRGVGYADGVFIAVGGSSKGQNATSPDGAGWTFGPPGTAWLADVVPLNGALVTAGGNGLRQRSLDGGVTWVDATGYYAGHYRAIAAGNGMAVAAGHTYGDTHVGLTSTTTDGKTWTPEVTGGVAFHSIAFGNGVFVAAGDTRCSTSTDGQAWKDCAGVSGSGFDGVVFANDRFILGDGAGYWLSTDGASWQHQDGEHHGVAAYGEGLYVALDWPDRISTSPDLKTWTVRQEKTGPALVQVAYGLVKP
ncbi:MAG: hypothetical protein QM820_21050 [Minicystis sp.]